MSSAVGLLALLGATACFNPEMSPLDSDDGEGSTSAASPDTSAIDTDGTPEPGVDTDQPSADGADGNTDGPEPGDTDDGPAPECEGHADCDAGAFCIEGACGPCSDADAPDQLCADDDPLAPLCGAEGQCVACVADSCSGDTPVCDPGLGCAACTEHSDCPDSACHLLGPEQGSCFDPGDVVDASTADELETALSELGIGSQRVIRLASGVYEINGTLQVAGEVAVIGQPGTVITGGATNLFVLTSEDTQRILYLSEVALDDGPFRAIQCRHGNLLWMDDITINGYSTSIDTDCDTYARRSRFTAAEPESVAIRIIGDGMFQATNSSIGPGSDTAVSIESGELRLYHSTIAGNHNTVSCDGSSGGGEIRNSIIVGAYPGSFSSWCSLTFADNAVDGGLGAGQSVGIFDSDWFVDAPAGDFHLSAEGQSVFADIADWDEGDPLFDVDGDPRPQEAPGYPGIDEVP
ncbi:MAG: hypothetical protein AAF799_38915 [Myxococcota bacterium]